jgi:hypothetical protein
VRNVAGRGKANPAVILLAFLLLLGSSVLWMAFGNKGPTLPVRTSIGSEGFGTGVHIGMSLEDARKHARASEKGPNIDVVYYAQEELANHDLYREHSTDRDLVAVIYSTDEKGDGTTVEGLRAYLGSIQAEDDRATLNGQFAANLGLDEVKQMYGKPFSETPEQSGRRHLIYYFADPTNPRLAYKLTTSHDYTGKIFSMALEQVLAPQ